MTKIEEVFKCLVRKKRDLTNLRIYRFKSKTKGEVGNHSKKILEINKALKNLQYLKERKLLTNKNNKNLRKNVVLIHAVLSCDLS